MDRPAGFGLLAVATFATDTALKVFDLRTAPISAILLFVTFSSALYAGALWAKNPPVALYWRWNWPWWGRVPLDLAARLAFKRLHGTIWTDFALSQQDETKRMNHMALGDGEDTRAKAAG